MVKSHITFILGAAREGRQSGLVAQFILDQIKNDSRFDITFVDAREYLLHITNPDLWNSPNAKMWRALVTKTDAFIIVSPEYNHGYPGELKLLLDMADKEYFGRPVLLCAVSEGQFGGARMVEHLVPILRQLGLLPLVDTLYFPHVDTLMKKDITQIHEEYQPRIKKAVDTLLMYIEKTGGLKK